MHHYQSNGAFSKVDSYSCFSCIVTIQHYFHIASEWEQLNRPPVTAASSFVVLLALASKNFKTPFLVA